MIGIDTNILVRLITKDDLHQLALVEKEIRAIRKNAGYAYVSRVVLCELFWVLKSQYKFTKQHLIEALETIILGEDFLIEEEDLVSDSFEIYEQSNADFADILIAQHNQRVGCKHTITFDNIAAKAKGFKKLG